MKRFLIPAVDTGGPQKLQPFTIKNKAGLESVLNSWCCFLFLETLARLGITHRRTAHHHLEGNSYTERLHCSLKEEEVWTPEYRSLEEGRKSIARWIEKHNHDRAHGGIEGRTPHDAFLAFAVPN